MSHHHSRLADRHVIIYGSRLVGSVLPIRIEPKEYLTYYATKFNTSEVDSTFYATPSVSTVNGWSDKTPEGFIIAAKVPQVVTHEKILLDCEPEFEEFVGTMCLLGDKLGPLVLRFPYFNEADLSAEDFLARLRSFLKRLESTATRFAIEIRNKAWLNQEFADLLRQHQVALVLQDRDWMPRPHQLKFDYVTTDFAYIRLLGDRKGIEGQTKVWDKVIVDRSAELQSWVSFCQQTVRRGIPTYVITIPVMLRDSKAWQSVLDPSNYNVLNRIRKLSKRSCVSHHRPCALGASYGVLVRTKHLFTVKTVQHLYCVLFTQGRRPYCHT